VRDGDDGFATVPDPRGDARAAAARRLRVRRRMLAAAGWWAIAAGASHVRCAIAADGSAASGAQPTFRVFHADPSSYRALLATLEPGDTLLLAPGVYDDPAAPPGLPIFGLHGAPDAPITITGPEAGPRPVFLGRATHNTIRIADASHVVVRNLDVDGRDLGGDGVNGQGPSHHIVLENLTIRGIGPVQGVVGISTNRAPAVHWTIRGCTIVGAGTGMYLGNSDGRNPFVAGVIERNVIRDTLGYNLQVKHQAPWPDGLALPEGRTITVIRDNVFSKAANGARGSQARPNVLVGDVPPHGRGSSNGYEILRNVFLQNPTEALLQAEGNVAIYANAFVNDAGAAISVQPHNGRVRDVLVLGNTIVAAGHGVSIRGGDPGHAQRVVGNAVFASPPLAGGNASANVTGGPADAARHLANPLPSAGERDFRPKPGALQARVIDVQEFAGLSDRDRDLDGRVRDWSIRGAYGADPGGGPASPGRGPKP
jgi:hypothetical protein